MPLHSRPRSFRRFTRPPVAAAEAAAAAAAGAATEAAAPAPVPAPSPAPASPAGAHRVAPEAWPAPTDPSWSLAACTRDEMLQLYQSVEGFLAFPGLDDYETARAALEPEWPTPRVIVYCLGEADVAIALAWARARQWPISVRSGGHNNAGYHLCNGLVIDVSSLNGVAVDGRTLRVGPGVNFEQLGAQGVNLPGGTCPDVCVAGYTMGGGYSLASRSFGMTCDLVTSARVMLADGSVVRASADANRELFWALRGGSGGQFGILLELEYALPPLADVYGFVLQWSLDDAAAVLAFLEEHHTWSATPRRERFGYLAALTHLVDADDPHKAEAEASLAVIAMFQGSCDEAHAELASLFDLGAPRRRYHRSGPYAQINGELFDVLPYVALGLQNATSIAASGLVGPAQRPDWHTLIGHVRKMPNPGNLIAFEPYGGAIACRDDAFNAYPHRQQKLDFLFDSFWSTDPAWHYNRTRASAQQWLDDVLRAAAPAMSGRVYANYASRSLADYRRAYWAQHFDRLLRIKQRFDPDDVFRFDQSISWVPRT